MKLTDDEWEAQMIAAVNANHKAKVHNSLVADQPVDKDVPLWVQIVATAMFGADWCDLSGLYHHLRGASMNSVSLAPIIEELESLFSKFNTRFFSGALEKPVISVSQDHTRGSLWLGVPCGRLGKMGPKAVSFMKSTFAPNT